MTSLFTLLTVLGLVANLDFGFNEVDVQYLLSHENMSRGLRKNM